MTIYGKQRKQEKKTQYGINITYTESNPIMNNAREFATKVKLLLEEIDDDFVYIAVEEIKKLKGSAYK